MMSFTVSESFLIQAERLASALIENIKTHYSNWNRVNLRRKGEYRRKCLFLASQRKPMRHRAKVRDMQNIMNRISVDKYFQWIMACGIDKWAGSLSKIHIYSSHDQFESRFTHKIKIGSTSKFNCVLGVLASNTIVCNCLCLGPVFDFRWALTLNSLMSDLY